MVVRSACEKFDVRLGPERRKVVLVREIRNDFRRKRPENLRADEAPLRIMHAIERLVVLEEQDAFFIKLKRQLRVIAVKRMRQRMENILLFEVRDKFIHVGP